MIWNPWHGCSKYSEGCKNCYVYRRDASIGKDASIVYKTSSFDMPIKKKRDGSYKLRSGTFVYACMTSDFFVEEADEWRKEIWPMIKLRSDCTFMIITKRIERFIDSIPDDWGEGYSNVWITSTCENQRVADIRLPILINSPITKKFIASEPLLSKIDMDKYLSSGKIAGVVAGGESGINARVCEYEWILDIREQCLKYDVPFHFKQTGYRFKKDNKLYLVKRIDQHKQARKAGINYKYDRLN